MEVGANAVVQQRFSVLRTEYQMNVQAGEGLRHR
jgi:hypothetical protein